MEKRLIFPAPCSKQCKQSPKTGNCECESITGMETAPALGLRPGPGQAANIRQENLFLSLAGQLLLQGAEWGLWHSWARHSQVLLVPPPVKAPVVKFSVLNPLDLIRGVESFEESQTQLSLYFQMLWGGNLWTSLLYSSCCCNGTKLLALIVLQWCRSLRSDDRLKWSRVRRWIIAPQNDVDLVLTCHLCSFQWCHFPQSLKAKPLLLSWFMSLCDIRLDTHSMGQEGWALCWVPMGNSGSRGEAGLGLPHARDWLLPSAP